MTQQTFRQIIYLYKFCNMLSILNKLILQKKMQNYVTNNVYLHIKVELQQQQNN